MNPIRTGRIDRGHPAFDRSTGWRTRSVLVVPMKDHRGHLVGVLQLMNRKAPDGRVRFERVPVTLDETEGSKWVVVEHGLDRGQRIVTVGAILLVDKV